MSATPTRMALLLIEDDDDDALIVEDLLAEAAMDVRLVRSSTLEEGLQQLPGSIDCVLLDLRLPDTVGLEGLERVRAAGPGIAVIVLTGLDDERTGLAAVDSGAQDYLVKGRVDGSLLARAIRYAMGRRHAEDVNQQLNIAEIRAAENARLERGLVPHPIVRDPSFWIASSYLPGRRRALLGGDFYDAVETADGRLNALVGDVSGHGPDEAALGAALRIAWRALTLSGANGELVLDTLQRVIEHERQVPGTFATLCILEIRRRDRVVRLWRAGHPAPVLITDGSVTSLPLDPGGPPLGMFPGSDWEASRLELPPDWSILLYTDGVVEGGDGGTGHLGDDGLRRLIAEYAEREPGWRDDPDELLRHLIARAKELNGEELSDDTAMLLVGSRLPAASGG